jgi:hypothetical protein
MHENGKTRHVGTIPGMGEGRIEETDGGVNSILIHCKSCKCPNVHPIL